MSLRYFVGRYFSRLCIKYEIFSTGVTITIDAKQAETNMRVSFFFVRTILCATVQIYNTKVYNNDYKNSYSFVRYSYLLTSFS